MGERPPKTRVGKAPTFRWHDWQSVQQGFRCTECFAFRSSDACLPMLGCKGPSKAMVGALSKDLGHQLAEVKVFLRRAEPTGSQPQGSMIVCLRCGSYSQHRCQNLGFY